jgi:hypothetical protein
VNLDAIAAASKTDDGIIIIESEGYPRDLVDLKDILPHPEEQYTSKALIRGLHRGFPPSAIRSAVSGQ